MAGLGRKVFPAGEVLTAANVQNYLMDQTVMVFASSSARSTSIGTAVSEGMVSYLSDTNAIEFYDGSAWTSVSNPGDITAVTAGTALSGGGTSGSVTLNVNLSQISIPMSQLTTKNNFAVTTAATGSTVIRNITLSTSDPSGGTDGQVWLKYEA